MIHVSSEQMDVIRRHAESRYPLECCGALLGQLCGEGVEDERSLSQVQPLDNVAESEQERRYLVDPDAVHQLLLNERNGGPAVIGFYHSHPDHPALPSSTDLQLAMPWYVYMILSVMDGRSGRISAWQLDEDGSSFVMEDIVVD